jgi:hypothetical protein
MFTRLQSRKSFSCQSSIHENEEPDISALIKIGNEEYGLEFPKVDKDFINLRKKIQKHGVYRLNKLKVEFESENSLTIIQSDTKKRLIPIRLWLQVVKNSHFFKENHNNFEIMVNNLEKYCIPIKAIFYLRKFSCDACFNSSEEHEISISVMEKPSILANLMKKLKL